MADDAPSSHEHRDPLDLIDKRLVVAGVAGIIGFAVAGPVGAGLGATLPLWAKPVARATKSWLDSIDK